MEGAQSRIAELEQILYRKESKQTGFNRLDDGYGGHYEEPKFEDEFSYSSTERKKAARELKKFIRDGDSEVRGLAKSALREYRKGKIEDFVVNAICFGLLAGSGYLVYSYLVRNIVRN